MNEEKSIGSRLATARVRRGLSLKEAADRIGHSTDFLAHIESGTEAPASDTLQRLAEAYGCSASELLGA